MTRLNWIFTLSSLNVFLVTVERFSFTTKILLQPFEFMRLHEMVQITTLILATVILPVLLLKEITDNFSSLARKRGLVLLVLFITGVYFYATGNGIHEVSSFNFNNFCNTQNFTGNLCGGFFFNDFYTGNIFYFLGGALMIIPLLILEKMTPNKTFANKDLTVLVINAVVYSLAIFAYAAFDRVLVGLIYSVVMTVISLGFFWPLRKKYLHYPLITYTTLTYSLGTLLALAIRH